jgi:hypothetical protein
MTTPTQVAVTPPQFPITSRYYSTATTTMTTAQGKTVVYLRRRFLPSADSFATVQFYTVAQADRLDNIANKFLGDPLAFWRICDANNVMRPQELTETPGRQIRLTLPEGIALPSHA